MQKILYVITKSQPFGGAQKYVYDLATSLPKDSYDVAVALGPKIQSSTTVNLKDKLEENGVHTIVIEAFQRNIHFGKELLALQQLITTYRREQPDIVHLNSSKAGGLGALAARLAGVPTIVFTSHGLAFEEDRPFIFRLIIQFFTWLTFLLAHRIIFISQQNLARVQHMPFMKEKCALIHNAIRPIPYSTKQQARETIASAVNPPDAALEKQALWVGSIGELHKNKGLSYLIRAIYELRETHPDIFLFIIGDGEQRHQLAGLIKHVELEDRVFLTGYIPDASRYVTAFDIFALTSVKEGHPYTLLEAGSAGIPTIGSAIPGITDIIDDMESGILVKPKRAREISRAIAYLITNPKKRSLFGGELQTRVQQRFSMENMLEITQELYKQSAE